MSRVKKIAEHIDPIEAMKAVIRKASDNPHPDYIRRRLICDSPCENREADPIFGGFMCSLCGCPLATLANSEKNDKCEAGKW